MATEISGTEGAAPDGGLAGRLSEMSHLTALAALDALIGAATVDDRAAAAILSKQLADRIARSTEDLQASLALD